MTTDHPFTAPTDVTEPPRTEAPREKSGTAGPWIRQFIFRRTVALSALLAVVTLLARAARQHWALDLMSHFPVQIAATALVLLAILVGLRRWKAAILPAATLVVNLAYLVPLYLPASQPSCSGPVILAISANVLRSNQQHTRFIEYIREQHPDFFLAMEVDENWLHALEPLHEDYPYHIAQPGRGAFGIALFSRTPIEDAEILESVVAGVPMIRTTMTFDDCRLTFIGVHPLPPVKSGNSELRNGQLEEIAALSAALPAPKLLLGDLNVTSWSPYFSELLGQTGMQDGRRGFGIQPTWPRLPWLGRIPIDHTLVSDDVEVVARRIGPDVGSDHRPVEIEFRIGD